MILWRAQGTIPGQLAGTSGDTLRHGQFVCRRCGIRARYNTSRRRALGIGPPEFCGDCQRFARYYARKAAS